MMKISFSLHLHPNPFSFSPFKFIKQVELEFIFYFSTSMGILKTFHKPALQPVSAAIWSPTNGNLHKYPNYIFCKFEINTAIMDAVKQLRSVVKKYIDTADTKVVNMVHAMLEVEKESNWWQDEGILSIIEERSADYKSGKVKGILWETAKKQILSSKRKANKSLF